MAVFWACFTSCLVQFAHLSDSLQTCFTFFKNKRKFNLYAEIINLEFFRTNYQHQDIRKNKADSFTTVKRFIIKGDLYCKMDIISTYCLFWVIILEKLKYFRLAQSVLHIISIHKGDFLLDSSLITCIWLLKRDNIQTGRIIKLFLGIVLGTFLKLVPVSWNKTEQNNAGLCSKNQGNDSLQEEILIDLLWKHKFISTRRHFLARFRKIWDLSAPITQSDFFHCVFLSARQSFMNKSFLSHLALKCVSVFSNKRRFVQLVWDNPTSSQRTFSGFWNLFPVVCILKLQNRRHLCILFKPIFIKNRWESSLPAGRLVKRCEEVLMRTCDAAPRGSFFESFFLSVFPLRGNQRF